MKVLGKETNLKSKYVVKLREDNHFWVPEYVRPIDAFPFIILNEYAHIAEKEGVTQLSDLSIDLKFAPVSQQESYEVRYTIFKVSSRDKGCTTSVPVLEKTLSIAEAQLLLPEEICKEIEQIFSNDRLAEPENIRISITIY